MKCIDFVNKYKKRLMCERKDISDMDKIRIITQIITIKNYLPVSHKKNIALHCLKQALVQNGNSYEFCSFDKYYSFVCSFLSSYTDLEIDGESYDILSEHNVLDYIISANANEYKICSNILDMYTEDLLMGRLKL